MREILNNWKNSAKYKQFQEELSIKKQNLFQLKNDFMSKSENNNHLSKEELLELILLIKDCQEEVEDNPALFDFSYFDIVGSIEDAIAEYIARQMNWFYYLGTYMLVEDEDYETAAQVRDAIEIEKRQFLNTVSSYASDESIAQIDNVDKRFYAAINNKFDEVNKQRNDERNNRRFI